VLNKSNKIVIGIIGGIASGKSAVAKLFKKVGKDAAIIDADKIGHEILDSPSIRKKLVSCYGKRILTGLTHVNRRYLGNICFSNKNNILRLNKLIHPVIRAEIHKKIENLKKGLIILDAALLLEGKLDDVCDYLVFVDVPYGKRLKRAIKERGWGKSELRNRESCQISLGFKKGKADFVIRNDKDLNDANKQVIKIIKIISTPPYYNRRARS
jgi:dephospho-CoA kinase